MAEWQTQWTQNPPGATPCEFDSRLGHLHSPHHLDPLASTRPEPSSPADLCPTCVRSARIGSGGVNVAVTGVDPLSGVSRWRSRGSVAPARSTCREDPNNPGQKLQTWWISYYVDGKRKRESTGTRKKSDAQALLKRRMGEHALGLELGEEAKRLSFEDLEAGFRPKLREQRAPIPPAGRHRVGPSARALRRLEGTRDHRQRPGELRRRAPEGGGPATVQYELAVLRRAMTLAVKKSQLRSPAPLPARRRA